MIYLITGGTGTFGQALLRRLLNSEAKEIRVFSRDESKQFDMKQEIKDERVKYFIGDVRNPASLTEAMQGVDYVFHAAAMKHVWSCEQFPMEAVATNVQGTANVIEAAIQAKVKKFILLSSDKAVYPVGVMGATKFLAEKLLNRKSETVLCGVRFGNLINSRGSVLGVWRKQLSDGVPCTLTDPNATRFVMTVEQAMDLVMEVFEEGVNGEMYIYEAKTCTVGELFNALSGFGYRERVKITGLQPGEKMHEYLTEEMCSENAERLTETELKQMI
jgi:UDP-N-acetylglucosamine 4,6-dehydratase